MSLLDSDQGNLFSIDFAIYLKNVVFNPDFISHGQATPSEYDEDDLHQELYAKELDKIQRYADFADVLLDYMDEADHDGECPYQKFGDALTAIFHKDNNKQMKSLLNSAIEYTAEMNVK